MSDQLKTECLEKKDQHLIELNLNSLGLIRLDELTKHRDHDVGDLFATSQFMEFSMYIPFLNNIKDIIAPS
jgi:hypothetical protein